MEDFSSGLMKGTTCMSSTIAPIPMEAVDAASSEEKTFAYQFAQACGGIDTSTNSTGLTSPMFSYISLCQNGKALNKFGLEEDYKDLRISIKLYDGKKCAENPDRYWVGKMKELDVTVHQNSQFAKTVETLFGRTLELLKKRGARPVANERWDDYQHQQTIYRPPSGQNLRRYAPRYRPV